MLLLIYFLEKLRQTNFTVVHKNCMATVQLRSEFLLLVNLVNNLNHERKLKASQSQLSTLQPPKTISILFNRNQSSLMSQDEQDSNLLLVPGIMNAPRTPGADSGQVSAPPDDGQFLINVIFCNSRKDEIENVQLYKKRKMMMRNQNRLRH